LVSVATCSLKLLSTFWWNFIFEVHTKYSEANLV
jgi:hypothetical protein